MGDGVGCPGVLWAVQPDSWEGDMAQGGVHMLERQGRAAPDCSELQLGGSNQLFHSRGSWGETEELGKT